MLRSSIRVAWAQSRSSKRHATPLSDLGNVLCRIRAMESLSLLAGKGQDAIGSCMNACFRYRHDQSRAPLGILTTKFGLESEDATAQVLSAGIGLVCEALRELSPAPSKKDALLIIASTWENAGTYKDVARALAATLQKRIPVWRSASALQRPSLPRLEALRWRVDLRASASSAARVGVPSALVELALRAQPARSGVIPPRETVQVELDARSLGTLVAGLRRAKGALDKLSGSQGKSADAGAGRSADPASGAGT